VQVLQARQVGGVLGQDSVVSWHSLSSKGLINGSSGRPSKSEKKKKQKQRVKGKLGSPHEEEYIVAMLRSLIPSPSMQHSVGRLVRSLMQFALTETARTLQGTFHSYLLLIEASIATLNISAIAVAKEQENVNKGKVVKPVTFEPIAWSLDFWSHQ